LFLLIVFSLTSPVLVATPVGSLDVADGRVIAGWARDDDFSGPIYVFIFMLMMF